jgi:hypothetical protein
MDLLELQEFMNLTDLGIPGGPRDSNYSPG